MFIYQILIEYDGSNFAGWQIQKNAKTVQEEIQNVIKKILKKNITLYGSGRTDKGVHAMEQSAHFKVNLDIINKEKFLQSLNFFFKSKKYFYSKFKKKKFIVSCKA